MERHNKEKYRQKGVLIIKTLLSLGEDAILIGVGHVRDSVSNLSFSRIDLGGLMGPDSGHFTLKNVKFTFPYREPIKEYKGCGTPMKETSSSRIFDPLMLPRIQDNGGLP